MTSSQKASQNLYFADFANFTEILCSNRSVKEQIFKYMLFASKVQQGVVMSICGRPTYKYANFEPGAEAMTTNFGKK